jgi:prolipoprotein diacylglyceryltransferase
MNVPGWLKNEKHRQLVERWWIAIVVAWEVIRTFAVNKAFGKYGVNPWVYFAIVMTIAVPYAICTAKLLFAIIEKHWRNGLIYGAISIVFHFAPDAYILASAKQVPKSLFDSFIFVVILFTVVGVRTFIVGVRDHHRKSNQEKD